jgi:erythronate-4-phosphate dehydrogenase
MQIVADAHIPYIQEYFDDQGELILLPGREINAAHVKTADILLVRSITTVDEALLKNSSVRFVGSITTGQDHLDIEFLERAGIAWCTAHGFNAPPVADYIISIIAALEQQKLLINTKKRIAVIGAGHIGKLVIEKLNLLSINNQINEIVICDPIRAKNELNKNNINFINLENITDVDLITLHVPLTSHTEFPTKYLINRDFLKKQKKDCILINASRGSVIHTHDLLEYGQHLHWCFDVFDPEPNINPEVLQHALIATPHIAGYSVQSKIRGIEMIYQKIIKNKILNKKNTPTIKAPTKEFIINNISNWQEVILNIFNPLELTKQLKNSSELFDHMRHTFNYRHELEFTTVKTDRIKPEDKTILENLGINIKVL